MEQQTNPGPPARNRTQDKKKTKQNKIKNNITIFATELTHTRLPPLLILAVDRTLIKRACRLWSNSLIWLIYLWLYGEASEHENQFDPLWGTKLFPFSLGNEQSLCRIILFVVKLLFYVINVFNRLTGFICIFWCSPGSNPTCSRQALLRAEINYCGRRRCLLETKVPWFRFCRTN